MMERWEHADTKADFILHLPLIGPQWKTALLVLTPLSTSECDLTITCAGFFMPKSKSLQRPENAGFVGLMILIVREQLIVPRQASTRSHSNFFITLWR